MMMMMTSAQIRAAGQGSGGGGAQLLRAGCPQGGVVAVGLRSGGRSRPCCPGGSQTNINAVDGGGKVVWMLLSRTPRAVCPGSSPCPDGATNVAVTPEGGEVLGPNLPGWSLWGGGKERGLGVPSP